MPVSLVIAVALGLTVFHNVGEKDLTAWETFSYLVVQSVVLFTAPVAGIVLGARAAVSGNRAATVATVIAAVGLAVLLFLGLSGGWLDTTPSVRM